MTARVQQEVLWFDASVPNIPPMGECEGFCNEATCILTCSSLPHKPALLYVGTHHTKGQAWHCVSACSMLKVFSLFFPCPCASTICAARSSTHRSWHLRAAASRRQMTHTPIQRHAAAWAPYGKGSCCSSVASCAFTKRPMQAQLACLPRLPLAATVASKLWQLLPLPQPLYSCCRSHCCRCSGGSCCCNGCCCG